MFFPKLFCQENVDKNSDRCRLQRPKSGEDVLKMLVLLNQQSKKKTNVQFPVHSFSCQSG